MKKLLFGLLLFTSIPCMGAYFPVALSTSSVTGSTVAVVNAVGTSLSVNDTIVNIPTVTYNGVGQPVTSTNTEISVLNGAGTQTQVGWNTAGSSVPVGVIAGTIPVGGLMTSANGMLVSLNGSLFTFSTNNSTTVVLGAGSTFTGTCDNTLSEPDYSILVNSTQTFTLTIADYIDSSCSKIAGISTYTSTVNGSSFTYRISNVINGNYFIVTAKNTGGSGATMNLNTYYGWIQPSTNLNNAPDEINAVNGSTITLGQNTMAWSLPVAIASNQSNLTVVGASSPAFGFTSGSAIPSVAMMMGYNTTNGSWSPVYNDGTESDAEPVFISTGALAVENYPMMFNGTTWDRQRGSVSGGLTVGFNNNPQPIYQTTTTVNSVGTAVVFVSTFANVAASQTNQILVGTIASTKICVHEIAAVSGGTATNITFNTSGGTAISPLFAHAANGGEVLPWSSVPWFCSVSGDGLGITTGAGSTTGVLVLYGKE